MRKFQIGDIVEYVNIHRGDIYKVKGVYDNHICLEGSDLLFNEKGFKLRQDLMREDKLNKLLTK